MIRPTDLVTPPAWLRPVGAPAAAEGVDSTQWFQADEAAAQAAIHGNLAPTARGLSAEQHAQRVLSFLQDAAA
jgi:hypothetical protein